MQSMVENIADTNSVLENVLILILTHVWLASLMIREAVTYTRQFTIVLLLIIKYSLEPH